MTHAEIEFYVRRGRAERSKAFYAGFRALRHALAGLAARLHAGFGHLHQAKAFR